MEGISTYMKSESKYIVSRQGEHFFLKILDVTLEDAGTYTCSSTIYEASATLLVLGK